jgi:genome maintenance exonuclease 1
LEDHITKKPSQSKNNLVYQLANKMANAIIENGLKHIPVVWGVEAKLYYEDLYAGTTDLVGLWKNKPAIIDFKTTKNKKTKKDIQHYFLQGVAYAHAHNQMFDTNIETVVILMADREAKYFCFETEPGEFDRYSDIWNNYLCQYYKLNIDA